MVKQLLCNLVSFLKSMKAGRVVFAISLFNSDRSRYLRDRHHYGASTLQIAAKTFTMVPVRPTDGGDQEA